MRLPRIHLAPGREFLLAAVLFLTCAYGAVFLIVIGELGVAGFALFCAYGFFQACGAFAGALDLRARCEQGPEGLDG